MGTPLPSVARHYISGHGHAPAERGSALPVGGMGDNSGMNANVPTDSLVIAGKTYSSRLLTGTGKFKDLEETRLATEAAGAQIVGTTRTNSQAPFLRRQ